VRVRLCEVVDGVAIKLVGVLAGCRDEDYAESRTEFGSSEEGPSGLLGGVSAGLHQSEPVLRFLFRLPVSIHVVLRPVFPASAVARIRAGLGIQTSVPPRYWRYFKDFMPIVNTLG
jgi:hypothetical protein